MKTNTPLLDVAPSETQNEKTPHNLADLERELVHIRAHIGEQRQHCSDLQQQFASKLLAQRRMSKERTPLLIAANVARDAEKTAQEALARHLNTATESVYADTLFEKEQALNVAQSELETFDSQHTNIDTAHMQAERDEIRTLEIAIEQETERVKTFATDIEQAVDQQIKSAIVRVLTAYQDLYTTLEHEGPTMARLRTHDVLLFHKLMPDLWIGPEQLWDCIHPYIDHEEDFRPFLKERQALMRSYLAKMTAQESKA